MSEEQTRISTSGTSATRLKQREKKPVIPSPEELKEAAHEAIRDISPEARRNTIRKQLEACRDDLVQMRKDGQTILDIAMAYVTAFARFDSRGVAISYFAKIISDITKNEFPRPPKKTPTTRSTSANSGSRQNHASMRHGSQDDRTPAEKLEEARQAREVSARNNGGSADNNGLPPGYRERPLDEL
ncbi:hypothetical protein HAP94_01770 [Acidithiobacillus ferrivorans]|nr:hypothetical protein [Acidithiobacillus ferrivorans]